MSSNSVILHKFIPLWGQPDLSPFCFKVEAYLRMADIPYTTAVADPRKAPKQKLPVIEDGALKLADSGAILAHLEATRGAPLDQHLNPQQRALTTAVRSMFEEHFYFIVVYQRWLEEKNWLVYREVFYTFGEQLGIPRLVRGLVVKQIRKGMLRTLNAQGVGRHSAAENTATAKRLLDSLETLCVGPYFLSDRPSTLDATAYAFLASLRSAPFGDAICQYLSTLPKLNAYCDHVHARHFA